MEMKPYFQKSFKKEGEKIMYFGKENEKKIKINSNLIFTNGIIIVKNGRNFVYHLKQVPSGHLKSLGNMPGHCIQSTVQ